MRQPASSCMTKASQQRFEDWPGGAQGGGGSRLSKFQVKDHNLRTYTARCVDTVLLTLLCGHGVLSMRNIFCKSGMLRCADAVRPTAL